MITSILKLFKSKYNSRDYGIAARDFSPACIYIGGKRHKVVDIYPATDGQSYFAVYKKKPIDDSKISRFADSKEPWLFHGEVNRILR